MRKLLGLLTLAWAIACPAATLTGTIKTPTGAPLTGKLRLTLSNPAHDAVTNAVIVPVPTTYNVTAGALPVTAAVVGNDTLIPRFTYYLAQYYNTAGLLIARNAFYVTGASFDIGAAVPTTITTSNISYAKPDSSISTYIASGTGAVTRNVQDKLRESVSVLDYMTPTQIADVKAGTASVDVTASIQKAIDNAVSGSTIIIPHGGTYLISAPLAITRSNIRLIIDGTVKLKAATNLSSGMIYIHGTSGAYISNVSVSGCGTLDGNRDNQPDPVIEAGLFFRYVNGVSVSGLHIKKVGGAIGTSSSMGAGISVVSCTDVRIASNYLVGNSASIVTAMGPGVYLPTDPLKDVQIINNYIDQESATYTASVGDGISLNTQQGGIVSGNIIKNIAYPFVGIYASVVSGGNIGKKGIISNNYLYNILGAGIECDIDSTYTNAENFVVSNNLLDGIRQMGISSFGASTITNNVLLNIGKPTAQAWGATSMGIAVGAGSSNTIVQGNFIDGGTDTNLNYPIVIGESYGDSQKNITISNNIAKNSLGFSIYVYTSGAGSILDEMIITGNQCDGYVAVQKYSGAGTNGVRYSTVTGNIWKGLVGTSVVSGTDSCLVTDNLDTDGYDRTYWAAGYINIATGNGLQFGGTANNAIKYDGVAFQILSGGAVKYRITGTGLYIGGDVSATSPLQISGVPVHANNAAAIAGGLTAGALYRTGADPDPIMIVH